MHADTHVSSRGSPWQQCGVETYLTGDLFHTHSHLGQVVQNGQPPEAKDARQETQGQSQDPIAGDVLIEQLCDFSPHQPMCGGSEPGPTAPPLPPELCLSVPPSTPPPPLRKRDDQTGFVTPGSPCSLQTAMSADYPVHPHSWPNQPTGAFEQGNLDLSWVQPAPVQWPLPHPCVVRDDQGQVSTCLNRFAPPDQPFSLFQAPELNSNVLDVSQTNGSTRVQPVSDPVSHSDGVQGTAGAPPQGEQGWRLPSALRSE